MVFNQVESGFHIPKLTLLEVWPLYPFIGSRNNLRVIDIGANTGLWAASFLNVFGKQTSYYQAFEPLPGNVDRLKQRVDQSLQSQVNQFSVTSCAVGNSRKKVKLNFNSEVSAIASVPLREVSVGQKRILHKHCIEVEQIDLDSWAISTEGFEPDIIKIDVEGYEWEVLEGTKNLISQKIPSIIYYEFGKHQADRGQTFLQFWEFFSQMGYYLYRQKVARNFFGLQYISKYSESLEEFDSMWMFCASKEKHDHRLNSPYVIGQYFEY